MIQIGQEFYFSEDLCNLLWLSKIYQEQIISHLIPLILSHVGCVDLFDDELLPQVARLHQEHPPKGPLANLPNHPVLFLHCDAVSQ